MITAIVDHKNYVQIWRGENNVYQTRTSNQNKQ
jgi:hypothetical protein